MAEQERTTFFVSEAQIEEIIEKLSSEKIPDAPSERQSFYTDRIAVYKMIFSNIISCKIDDSKIIELWKNVITHKYILSEKIGRNIGFRVAVLDYLFNFERSLNEPIIVENEKYEKLIHEAKTDFKTGIYNARHLYYAIDKEIDRSKRYGHIFSLLLFDIDNFKLINDTLGHIKGDILLAQFSAQLQKSLRVIDIAARFGGDEFCVLFPQTSKKTTLLAAQRIQRIIQKCGQNLFPDFTPLTISGGIATYPACDTKRIALLSCADKALFRAKQNGKNQISICNLADADSCEQNISEKEPFKKIYY